MPERDSSEPMLVLKREQFYTPEVEQVLDRQRAYERLATPSTQAPPVPWYRRALMSSYVYTPALATLGALLAWAALAPYLHDSPADGEDGHGPFFAYTLLKPFCIVAFTIMAEGLTRRLWILATWGAIKRGLLASALVLVALLPFVFLLALWGSIFDPAPYQGKLITAWPGPMFLSFVCVRSYMWLGMGTAIGLALQLGRGTRAELRNCALGGAVGGVVGGVQFDAVDRFIQQGAHGGDLSRFIGAVAVGFFVGLFAVMGERLGREAWFRVKTGPLAGKAFVLYRNPTTIGSRSQENIYLFKDSQVSATHAIIYRSAGAYEIEDVSSKSGVLVNGHRVQRRRLVSGDQVTIGATVLEFEERAKKKIAEKIANAQRSS